MQHFSRWERIIVGTLAGSIATGLFSGGVAAFFYHSSDVQYTDLKLYHAQSAIVDWRNDTLLHSDEWALLDTIPPYHGKLEVIGTSANQWTAAYLSHVLLRVNPAGRSLHTIHSISASITLVTIGLLQVLLCFHGRKQRKQRLLIFVLFISTIATSWLGMCLPSDARAHAAYSVGRAFLVDNLPIIGDIIAAILPLRLDTARVFAIHALWISWALIVGSVLVYRWFFTDGIHILMPVTALTIAAIGIIIALVEGPLLSQVIQPVWHLSLVYWLLERIPMDLTMLILLIWWGLTAYGIAGASTRLQQVGALLILVWLIANGFVSMLLQAL